MTITKTLGLYRVGNKVFKTLGEADAYANQSYGSVRRNTLPDITAWEYLLIAGYIRQLDEGLDPSPVPQALMEMAEASMFDPLREFAVLRKALIDFLTVECAIIRTHAGGDYKRKVLLGKKSNTRLDKLRESRNELFELFEVQRRLIAPESLILQLEPLTISLT